MRADLQPEEESEYADDSRGRIRRLIHEGSHPESLTEQIAELKPALRSGDPFPFVIAVVPAFNEQEMILRTIDSLRAQTRRADEIIVLADNCTDGTVAIALAAGVSVVATVDNGDGKAGALNALLAEMMPLLDDNDCVLVMDADTMLTERFIEATVTTLFSPSKKPIAGVGGIFLAYDDSWSLVRQLQSNEYVRYQRRLSRRKGRALVLTGTGTVFRIGFMREVQQARRDGRLPDPGQTRAVYDISALTEDNELTLCAKELGYRVVSPKDCTVKTAMMPTWSSLYKQRRRWQRGALENLIAHGLNRHTAPYAIRQVLTYLGVLFLPFYLWTLTVALIVQSSLDFFQPLWVGVAVLYVCEQTFSVRKGGWRAVLVSLAIVPEIALDVFLDVVYVMSYYGTLFATDETWGRMRHLDSADFDKQGRPLGVSARPPRSSLRGTHAKRRTLRSRLIEILLAVFGFGATLAVSTLPLVNLTAAWFVVAIYVLAGSLATVGRLIPVRTY
ncbi:MAG: glycosyltransferase family 2 protein [Mycobacterium sp.]|nr:glycosyltransferase family 2 protein [Mycobacterium sp.]